jgi:hypothetical protein
MAWNVQWYWAPKKEWITLSHPLYLSSYDHRQVITFPVDDETLAKKAADFFAQEHAARTRVIEVKVKA